MRQIICRKLIRFVDLGFSVINFSDELAYHCFEIAHLKNHKKLKANSDLPDGFDFAMEEFNEEK